MPQLLLLQHQVMITQKNIHETLLQHFPKAQGQKSTWGRRKKHWETEAMVGNYNVPLLQLLVPWFMATNSFWNMASHKLRFFLVGQVDISPGSSLWLLWLSLTQRPKQLSIVEHLSSDNPGRVPLQGCQSWYHSLPHPLGPKWPPWQKVTFQAALGVFKGNN